MTNDVKKTVSNQQAETDKDVNSSIKNDSILPVNPLRSIPKRGLFRIDGETGFQFFKSPTGVEYLLSDFSLLARVKTTKHGKEQASIFDVCSRIDVVAEASTAEGEGYSRLVRFVDSMGRKHEQVISRGDIATSPAKVVNGLVSAGLSVFCLSQNTGNKFLIDYLNNCPVDKHIQTVDAYGWVELGKCFIIPNATINRDENHEVVFNGDPRGTPVYSQAGTLRQWQETIGQNSRHSSRVALGVCVALASPLIRFSNEQSGIFHLSGDTSQGKTTAIRAGVSVWGEVRDGSGEMASSWLSNGTNGIEVACKNHSDLPLFLDEFGQSEEKKQSVASIIYMIGNGAGKQRMLPNGKGQDRATWSLLALSTGEKSPRDLMQELGQEMPPGAEVRMPTIQACTEGGHGVFETLPKGVTAKDLANSFKADGARYYGTAGVAFMRAFIDDVHQCGGVDAMKARIVEKMNEWVEAHAENGNSQIQRVASRFALVAVAGELAIEYGVLPWDQGEASKQLERCFQSFLDGFETIEERKERLCRQVFDFIACYPESFDSIVAPRETVSPAKNPRPLFGTVIYSASPHENVRGEPVIVSFTEEGFKRAGGTHHEIKQALVSRGYLRTSGGGQTKDGRQKLVYKYQPKGSSKVIKVGGITLPKGYILVDLGAYDDATREFVKGSIFDEEKRKK